MAPLNAPEQFLNFRKSLDQLATKNDQVLSTLLGIKELVEPVLPSLLTAASAPDIVQAQTDSVIALAKQGLGSNFMIAIPLDDTNGGGNLSNPGGNFNIPPLVGAAMLADVYVKISR